MLHLIAHACISALTPTTAVHAVADHILNDTADAHEFQSWGYGQSIIIDAMLLASENIEVTGVNFWLDAIFS